MRKRIAPALQPLADKNEVRCLARHLARHLVRELIVYATRAPKPNWYVQKFC
jgi:hypothetical protein